MCNVVPLKWTHLVVDMFITDGFVGFIRIVLCYLVYLKDELMEMEDESDILGRFSSTYSQEKVDWEGVLKAAMEFRVSDYEVWGSK